MAPSAEVLASAKSDPQFKELLKNAGPQPFPVGIDLQTLRTVINAMRAKAREAPGDPPPSLSERDIEIPVRDGSKISAYVYAPVDVEGLSSLPILLFFHGGGFCIGNRHDDSESNRIIAAKAGIVIVSLEYRLAPEYPFPQAIHDGLDALHWVVENPKEIHPRASKSAGIIVAGTSAGGSIANAVVCLNRDQQAPARVSGQFLSVPPLLLGSKVPSKYRDDYVSHEQNKEITIPPPDLAGLFIAAYKPDMKSPLAVPFLHPSGHAGIPPTYIQVCGLDALRDEGLLYGRFLQEEHGIATRVDLYPGLPHHFWEFFPQLTTQIEKRTEDTVKGVLWLLNSAHVK